MFRHPKKAPDFHPSFHPSLHPTLLLTLLPTFLGGFLGSIIPDADAHHGQISASATDKRRSGQHDGAWAIWRSLILGKWNPVFQFLPVENMAHTSQQAYYDAINASSEMADCASFIDFMLGEIHRTLDARKGEPKGAGIGINIGLNIGINETQKQILLLVKESE